MRSSHHSSNMRYQIINSIHALIYVQPNIEKKKTIHIFIGLKCEYIWRTKEIHADDTVRQYEKKAEPEAVLGMMGSQSPFSLGFFISINDWPDNSFAVKVHLLPTYPCEAWRFDSRPAHLWVNFLMNGVGLPNQAPKVRPRILSDHLAKTLLRRRPWMSTKILQ